VSEQCELYALRERTSCHHGRERREVIRRSAMETTMATAEDYQETWYHDAMESREQELRNVFGPSSPADMVFKPADESFETTIPGFAFLRFPPTTDRPFWLYMTHGLAQPAEFEDFCEGFNGGGSGYGIEFALATAQEESWPFALLELLAGYLLSSRRPIYPGDRIPSSDLMEEARGGGLMALPTPSFSEFKTLSGTFDIIHFVGATVSEIKKAKTYPGHKGSWILELVLRQFGIGGVTDRKRVCTTKRADFDRVWSECEAKTPPEDT
jgi:hypothetical protein